MDRTVYNGHNAAFEVGTMTGGGDDDPAPIRSMRVYCNFRHHTGRAWFDDLRLVRE